MAKLFQFTVLLVAVVFSVNGQLRTLAETHKRYVGMAVSPAHLAEEEYVKIADREFDCFTPENQMKWGETEHQRGVFSFHDGDTIVNHAQAHGQKVRGHTLVWHNHLPAWLSPTAAHFNASELEKILHHHVTEQAGHWKGKIYAWDVVNEVLNEDGTLRHSVFYPTLGKKFIADSFKWAHEADPAAKLYINDYGVEAVNHKSTGLLELVKELKAENVPVNGVGFQAHFSVGHLPHDLKQNLERFAALELDVAITELDIKLNMPATEAEHEQQAKDYVAVFSACLSVPRCVGVSMWGMTDKYSNVVVSSNGAKGSALLFDEHYKEKKAYEAVKKLLAEHK